ncbi:hypothetical protein MAR_021298 [Mya arenaria]|uniref:Uncharacterized protein n=1 Tax=Mya arenaria TaxID=6604 RepID=A0ABY7EBZ5_MYAAR|nr:hypothetical protein MAR_021298 [Mya arenaria]
MRTFLFLAVSLFSCVTQTSEKPSRMTLTTSNVNITCVARGGRPAPRSDEIIERTDDLLLYHHFFTEMCATPQTFDFERISIVLFHQGNEEVTESTIDSATTVRSDPTTVSLVTQTSYVAGALIAIMIIVLLVYFLWYRRRSSGGNCNAKYATIKSNANQVFVKPILPSNEHLTNQEQAEYTEIDATK